MVRSFIQVTLIDSSRGEKCEGRCGLDWSSAETIALARQRIKDRFGDRVQLEYLDLADPEAEHHPLAAHPQVRTEDLPLPVLMIDDKLRISGQFDIRQLLDTIDAEMEIIS